MRTLTPSSWLDAPGEQGAGTDPRMSPSHSFFLCPLLVVHLPTLPTPKGPSPPGQRRDGASCLSPGLVTGSGGKQSRVRAVLHREKGL